MPIRFALIAEGGTEAPLVDILQSLCRRAGEQDVLGIWGNDLLALTSTAKDVRSQIQRVFEYQPDLNLVFVHRDADAADDTHARAVVAAGAEASGALLRTIAVVPIQETEAWLLTNEAEIRRVAGNPRGRVPLDLPKVGRIEQRASPKEVLRQVLAQAAKPGRQQREIRSNDKVFARLRRQLLERLDIEGSVTALSAWQKLIFDIASAVEALGTP